MDPFEYLRIVRRRWGVIALAVLFSLVAVVVTKPPKQNLTALKPVTVESYRATHVLLSDPADKQAQQNVKLVGFFVNVGEVRSRAAAKVGAAGGAAAAQVSAAPEPDVGAIRIEASGRDADRTAALANAFATELIAYIDETLQNKHQATANALLDRIEGITARMRELEKNFAGSVPVGPVKAQYDALQRQYATTYDRYNQLLATPAPTSGLFTVQEATPVPVVAPPTTSKTLFRLPTGGAARVPVLVGLGLLVGLGCALLIERIDTRLRTKEATEEALGLPVLAEVPVLPRHRRRRHEVTATIEPGSMFAEAYRMLRAALLLTPRPVPGLGARRAGVQPLNGKGQEDHLASLDASLSPSSPGVILVASPGPGEGKTTSVANLAATFAESGNSVIVLNCDFHNPQIHRFFGLEEGRGLTDVLTAAPGAPELEEIALATAIPGVRVVPSGSSGVPIEPFALGPRLIARARKMADIVLIDTSPLLATSDARELIPSSDAVLVVIRAGRTTADAARRASELLVRLGAPAAGAVLVAARESRPPKPTGGHLVKVSRLVDLLASLLPHPRRLRRAGGASPSRPDATGTVDRTEPAVPAPLGRGDLGPGSEEDLGGPVAPGVRPAALRRGLDREGNP